MWACSVLSEEFNFVAYAGLAARRCSSQGTVVSCADMSVSAQDSVNGLADINRFSGLLRGAATHVEVVGARRKSGLNRDCAWSGQGDWRREIERPSIRSVLADGATVGRDALPFDRIAGIS